MVAEELPVHYNVGRIVAEQPLTCLRCIVDSGEGNAFRQEQKVRNFGALYGRNLTTGRMSSGKSNVAIQNLPPRKR